MTRIYLQYMVENLPEGVLPANWTDFDLASYSRGKRLWEYQQTALRNALLALWKYYETPGRSEPERKQAFMAWYRDFGLEAGLDISLDRSTAAKRRLASLLQDYYTSDGEDHLPYEQRFRQVLPEIGKVFSRMPSELLTSSNKKPQAAWGIGSGP